MMGPGMMGGWTGGWGWLGWLAVLIGLLLPLGVLILLVAAAIWLFRQASVASQGARSGEPEGTAGEAGQTCPSCGQPVQSDWRVCPYCGQDLV